MMSKLKTFGIRHPRSEKPARDAENAFQLHPENHHGRNTGALWSSRSSTSTGSTGSSTRTGATASQDSQIDDLLRKADSDSLKPPPGLAQLQSSHEGTDLLTPLRSVGSRWKDEHVYRIDARQQYSRWEPPYVATSQKRARILKQTGGKHLEYLLRHAERRPSRLDENIGSSSFAAKLYSERGLSRYAWTAPEFILRETHGFSNFIEYELHAKAANRCQLSKDVNLARHNRPSRILNAINLTRKPAKWIHPRRSSQKPPQASKGRRRRQSRPRRTETAMLGAFPNGMSSAQSLSRPVRGSIICAPSETHHVPRPTTPRSSIGVELNSDSSHVRRRYFGNKQVRDGAALRRKPHHGRFRRDAGPQRLLQSVDAAIEVAGSDISKDSSGTGSTGVIDEGLPELSLKTSSSDDEQKQSLEEKLSGLDLN
ncbi:uncharacterized protein F5Z01DRAFT_748045 [Emericellopsis atlantica]|uniref:Uncharacterized protein n=1 Tax=Emericellopsis atlantica TaxID=2614577 RepID=A0A9P7ZRY2_9HYPO|nr:uncharacterized protein F5Z01DRAFT_748045 [Emericellopsis atlantica]KAG9257199.1 hypothetical protein F5Z01DRAFT_748045 [Emericellopsis atlantica]